MLLYNGDSHYQFSTQLGSLIALPEGTPLWHYQPNMRYYLIDENQYPQGKQGSISGLVFKLENVTDPQQLKEVITEVIQALPPQLDSLKRAFAVWMNHVLAPHKGINLPKTEIEKLQEVKDMLSTRICQWENKIANQALAEGKAEGKAERVKQKVKPRLKSS